MASSPRFKVYDAEGRYQAACHEAEAAACLVELYGDGSTVRDRHRLIVWREGQEEQSAAGSWDYAAQVMLTRAITHHFNSH